MIGQLGLGGTEKQLVLLAKGLRERGVTTTVLVMFDGGPGEEALRQGGIPVVRLGFRNSKAGWRMPLVNLMAFFRLVTLLRRMKPDIVHAFLFHAYVLAPPAIRLAGVPVLVAGRRSMGEFAEGHRVFLIVERIATRATDFLIANAWAVAKNTLSREKVPPGKVSVIYNALPESAFGRAQPASFSTELPVVLCVANLLGYKGHRFLLQSIAKLQSKGLPCTLVLVGEGPERVALERQSKQIGIDTRFLGARRDVPALLARADVFVLPSLHEGMSNAVMEAMAAGLPIVATEVGGTGELLKGRGILVPPADPDALAEGLRRVLTEPQFAQRLVEEARAWSRANLHVNDMVDQHIRIYSELLGSRCAE
jgi:glycosyltransferase involved in cell wall biosynthesis